MEDRDRDVQLQLLGLALSICEAPAEAQTVAMDALMARPGSVLRERAPYLGSVTRLVLTLMCGLPRGLVGPRPTHVIDLIYLYYAPFCHAFASSDKLHRDLWPATTTGAQFLWGPDLLQELRRRAAIRSSMTDDHGIPTDQWAAYRQPYGQHPPPLDGSIINPVWDVWMPATGPIPSPRAKKVSDLEPEVQLQMREFLESIGEPWRYG